MAAHDADLFERLQDEFDALLSNTELPDKQRNVQTNELAMPDDPVLQDTSDVLLTTDMRGFDIPSDGPTKPVAETVMPETARETIAAAHETTEHASDSSAANKASLQESDLSHTVHTEQANQQPPMTDNQTPDPVGIDPFSDEMDVAALEKKAPVHPDMAEARAPQPRNGSRYIVIAGFMVLAIAGGIYWLVSGIQEQPEHTVSTHEQNASTEEQTASSQEQNIPGTAPKQTELPDSLSVSPVETLKSPAAIQKAETVNAPIQRKAVEKAKRRASEQAASIRDAAEKAIAAKQAAETRVATEKAKAAKLAAKQATKKRTAAKKTNANQVVVVNPLTPVQRNQTKAK